MSLSAGINVLANHVVVHILYNWIFVAIFSLTSVT